MNIHKFTFEFLVFSTIIYFLGRFCQKIFELISIEIHFLPFSKNSLENSCEYAIRSLPLEWAPHPQILESAENAYE
jgi:hypothetical protein